MPNSTGAYIDPRLPESRRSAPRRLVSIPVTVSSSALKAVPAELTNISRLGCRVEVNGNLALGEVMLISLPTPLILAARVIWSESMAAGFKFADPVGIGVLDRLIEMYPAISMQSHSQPLASWRSSRRHR
jgi:hypothetical protein